jgi:hypothetical protein
MAATVHELLASITNLWKTQVALCRNHKWEKFGKTAKKVDQYLGKRYRDLTFEIDEDSMGDFPGAKEMKYTPVLNKSRQFLDLYLPFVHAAQTHRLVRPRRPQLPPELAQLGLGRPDVEQGEKIQAFLLEWWLNYLPGEYDAFTEDREAIHEALTKGRGMVVHEMIPGPYGEIPGSFHLSVDHLLIDADARKFRTAGFIILETWEPCHQVAEDYREDIDKLRGRARTAMNEAVQQAENVEAASDKEDAPKGDLCRVWRVYSRIGVGHRLVGAGDDPDLQAFGAMLDEMGPHTYLVFTPNVPYPLNLKPDDAQTYGPGPELRDFLREQLSWPIPFFEEPSNPWPVSVLDPYPNPTDAWATSPLEAGLPIQEYLDKAYNWIMGRLRRACRTLNIYSTALEKAIVDAAESAVDLELVPYNGKPGEELATLWATIEFPDITGDAWKVLALLSEEFEKATGMTPLMHGMRDQSAMRSAQEAAIRESHTQSRPQDIAKAVEEWQSRKAAKEAQASRLAVEPTTVAPLFAEPMPEPLEDGTFDVDQDGNWAQMGPLTTYWKQLVTTEDPALAAAEMHYTVEAGSGRRKNRQWMQEAAQTIMPLVMPLAQQEYVMGNPTKWNALMQMVSDGWEIPMQSMMQPLSPEFNAMVQMIQQAQAAEQEGTGAPAAAEGGPPSAIQAPA